ncbi:MAG TPA: TlpA disulfide reductase family protein [Bacteroidales bacterium]|nr:TlpA disulfide reductase family protein [Bacteroidales bacterium]
MKKFVLVLFVAAALAGCGEDDKVVIKGSFGDGQDGVVYLDQSDVDRSTVIDSAVIKRNRFKFSTALTGPEFLQVRLNNNDFVGLLASPGEEIILDFKSSPLVMNYTVSGSSGSDLIRGLDQYLFATKVKLDSLTNLYTGLSDEELAVQGPGLEKAYVDAVEAQRKHNIEFILENITSLASIKALYQRIDENTYVLYQPRDLQFLKIVSDSLSVKYPVSKHVRALKENVTSELNRMYIDRLTSMATEVNPAKTDPVLPDPQGKMIRLSSLRGKYVLVTFWATTSEDCLAELSALKNIYSLYHSKGLEIYQVSLDADAARWKNVVKFEEIPWISVREEDPGNPAYAMAMNISRVPSNLLFDPEGNIINTNLFGRNLQIRMDQLFNK